MSDDARFGADVVVSGDNLTLHAFGAMCRALSIVYPDARVTNGENGMFAITLGEMTSEPLPEWLS